MATRKLVQDIVPSERRSVRKIIIEDEDDIEDKEEEVTKIRTRRIKSKVNEDSKPIPSKLSNRNLITFIIILISFLIFGVALSLSYSKGIVTITPKIVKYSVDGTFIAKKDALNDDLSYQSITVSDKIVQSIPATKGPLIQTKAKGSVTLYNNFSASSQVLVAGTRISSPDGLIYRTSTTVNIPGKKTLPGSANVSVVADQAGEAYNASLSNTKSNFTIPGYKGTPKFSAFYAKLKTDLVGGFSGNKMIISEQSKKEAVTTMENSLKPLLISKLNQNVPKDYIFYKDAYNIEFEVSEPIMKTASSAEIQVTGTGYGAIFNKKPLISFIAGKEINKFPSDNYTVEGDSDLVFSISNSKDFSIKKSSPLIFTLKGPLKITGTFSELDLKNQLKGIKLQDSNLVFSKYPSITSAYALITPFWMRSFPNSVERINIEYKH